MKQLVYKFFIACTLFFLLPGVFLCGMVDIFGYFENRFFVLENHEESWKDLGEKLRLGDYNRLRLNFKASPSDKITVNASVDFYTYHGMINTPLWLYIGTKTPTASDVRIDLDRAYVDLYFKKFDLSIGKQRIPLGVSYLWAPLDIFSRVNVFEPKEEKAGVTAFKAYVPLGTKSSITAVFSPDNKVKASTSVLCARTQVMGIDAGLTLIRQGDKETTIYGLDLRGENFIGWWIEAGYFVSPPKKGRSAHVKDTKIVLGLDYTFPLKNGLYWLNEFYYDTSGAKDISEYDYTLSLTGKRFTLGQRYFFSQLSYSFSNFLTASLGYIGNLGKGDGSFLLCPTVQYEIVQNIYVSSGFYFPIGPKEGEYTKFQENTFFIWLKINF